MTAQLAVFLLLSSLSAVLSTDPHCGFLLTAPKALIIGVEESLCITFHDITDDVNLIISIHDKKAGLLYSQSEYFRNGAGRCFPFRVPLGLAAGQMELHVNGSTTTDCVLSGKTKIYTQAPKTLVYIQTDKPIYKPGQTVQFRILSLKSDLKPNDVEISQVAVEDPSGARVMQWSNLTTSRGLLSLSMPLASEPALGQWKLKVSLLGSQQKQTFKVDEYVLPKFEVSVNMPTYILANVEKIEGEICAKYTYGQPVKGSAKLKLCIKQQYYYNQQRPCSLQSLAINGCVKFSVATSDVQLTSRKWSLWAASVAVEAIVTENATGVSLNGSSSHTKVERTPFNIDIKEGSMSYYKPGLPFHGKVLATKPDGTPASGEMIKLRAMSGVKERFSHTYTTDVQGSFSYTLPPQDKDEVEFSITATAPLYKRTHTGRVALMFIPTAYHNVKQWFSPSGSYVQITLNDDTVSCGTNIQASVLYTTEANTQFKFHYQVISRGNIVWTGHKTHHFKAGHGHARNDPSVNIRDSRPRRTIMPRPPLPPGTEEPERVPELPHIGNFIISVPISAEMSPSPKLLIFYVREDGETVADSVTFSVDKCFDNNVSLRFGSRQLLPGQQMSLTVGANPGSLCALGVVDKSVHLLGGNNKLTKEKVFKSLKKYELNEDSQPHIYDDYCDRYLRANTPPRPPPGPPGRPIPFGGPEPLIGRRRERRMIFPHGSAYSKYYDSSKAFKVSGMVVVTNLDVATRPCFERPMVYYSMAVFDDARSGPRGAGGGSAQNFPAPAAKAPTVDTTVDSKKSAETVVDLRTYFPETWIWQLVDIGNSGQGVLQEELPHTITEWVGSAFCTNTQTGLGVSDMAMIKAFQPFFVSFTLPYSVIRKEKVPVLVTVFNYLSDCLVVELTLKNDPGFKIMGDSRRTKVCVCGSESISHTYYIVANTIGDINITVKAVSVSDAGVCSNDVTLSTQTGARDAVTRTLIVEPEGKEEENTVASFICPADGETQTESFALRLPETIVADSARGYVTVIGDVMGSSISGLDELLKMPTGCGEQNMIKFAPNIFVMQYLTHTDQLVPSIQSKALNFMRVGYQRELTYRHADGSYSAFGESDDEGSMWLTAFVVRSFAQARPFISIDDKDLQKSLIWFKSKQLENGCFPMVGRVLHKDMKGGLASSRAPAALTAYVLIAMLDADVALNDTAVKDALLCLQSQTSSDIYTAALVAYAHTLYSLRDPGGLQQRSEAMRRLESLATKSNGMMHWHIPRAVEPTANPRDFHHKPASVDVEVTAYALLSYVSDGSNAGLIQGLPIVRWLTKQRNSHGGFSSTQDTVLALQALASYAALAYRHGISMQLAIRGNNFEKTFSVTEHNKLVLQTEPIAVPNNLTVSASGRGCVMFQANARYNVPVRKDEPTAPAFDLKLSIPNRGQGSGPNACKRRQMTVCTRYTGPGEASNMAIVAVKMVSGWIPDKDSVKKIKQDSELGVKRLEIDHKWVNFYFDELTNQTKCITFVIEQDMEVKNAKPAYVEVYDYYDKDLIAKGKYRIKRVCGTKNELPFLTREEYNKAEESGFTGQMRVPNEPLFELFNTTPKAATNCPTCLVSVPSDFAVQFCEARHAYRTDVQRSPPRVLADLRPVSKRNIMKSVTISLPAGCSCTALSSPGTSAKVLILTRSAVQSVNSRRSTLHIEDGSTVIPLPSTGLKRMVKRALKRRGCGL